MVISEAEERRRSREIWSVSTGMVSLEGKLEVLRRIRDEMPLDFMAELLSV